MDVRYVSKVETEDMVSALNDELTFLKVVYDAVRICTESEKIWTFRFEILLRKLLLNALLCLKELRELQENMKETSVVVQLDNSRVLNMDQIVSEVKLQYEEIAARSREEAENWHKTKVIKTTQKTNVNFILVADVPFDVCWDQFDQMTAEADQYGNDLRSTKAEISELNRMISRLQNEVANVKTQVS